MALGYPGEVVNCRLPGLPAVADRKIQGMEVGVLAHALPAFLRGERGQEERHGLPVLLGHDGGPGRRAEHVAGLLTPVLAATVAGVKRLEARFEQRAFVRGLTRSAARIVNSSQPSFWQRPRTRSWRS